MDLASGGLENCGVAVMGAHIIRFTLWENVVRERRRGARVGEAGDGHGGGLCRLLIFAGLIHVAFNHGDGLGGMFSERFWRKSQELW